MPTDINGRWYEDEQDAWAAPPSKGNEYAPARRKQPGISKPQPIKWKYGQKKNSHQHVIQLSTQYEAWIHDTDLSKNGIEIAFYDAFKHNYHPENNNWAKQNRSSDQCEDIPF